MTEKRFDVIEVTKYEALYDKCQALCDKLREMNSETARLFQQAFSTMDAMLNEIKNANLGLTHFPNFRSRSGAHKAARKLNNRYK